MTTNSYQRDQAYNLIHLYFKHAANINKLIILPLLDLNNLQGKREDCALQILYMVKFKASRAQSSWAYVYIYSVNGIQVFCSNDKIHNFDWLISDYNDKARKFYNQKVWTVVWSRLTYVGES